MHRSLTTTAAPMVLVTKMTDILMDINLPGSSGHAIYRKICMRDFPVITRNPSEVDEFMDTLDVALV